MEEVCLSCPHQLSTQFYLTSMKMKPKWGKWCIEISHKIPSNGIRYTTCMMSVNNVMYTLCITSVTNVGQEWESIEEFSPVKKSKLSNVPSSLDIQRLMKHQVSEGESQDQPNPLPKYLKAKEGIINVKSKGSKSTPHCQPIVETPKKTFVSETQNMEGSPEEIQKLPDPLAKRQKKRVSQQV